MGVRSTSLLLLVFASLSIAFADTALDRHAMADRLVSTTDEYILKHGKQPWKSIPRLSPTEGPLTTWLLLSRVLKLHVDLSPLTSVDCYYLDGWVPVILIEKLRRDDQASTETRRFYFDSEGSVFRYQRDGKEVAHDAPTFRPHIGEASDYAKRFLAAAKR